MIDIDHLEAGPEFNALIHKYIFDKEAFYIEGIWCDSNGSIPDYTRWLPSAWNVVELFRRGFRDYAAAVIELTVYDSSDEFGNDIVASIYAPNLTRVWGSAKTPALAYCRAAYKIVYDGTQTL